MRTEESPGTQDPASPPRSPEPRAALPPELWPRSPLGRVVDEVLRFGRKGVARVIEFAPARLNFSWITDNLAVGGAFHTRDIPRLQRRGITAVVDCREEACDDEAALRRHGIELLQLPAPDTHELSQEMLDRGAQWVSERLARGEKVYVHCLHGVGRGPLMGCCVLMESGLSATEALRLLKTRRWQASPNEEQLAALVRYGERHPRTTGESEPA